MTNTPAILANAAQGITAGHHDATPLQVVGIDRSATLTLVKFQAATGARFGIPLAAALNDPDLLAQLSATDQQRLSGYPADNPRRNRFATRRRLVAFVDAIDDRTDPPASRHALRSRVSDSPSLASTTGAINDE